MISSAALQSPRLRHGFFTREGGHSSGLFTSLNCGLGSGDDRALVMKNRAIVAKGVEVAPDHLLSAYQVHSAKVAVVDGPWASEDRPKVDALVTTTPGVALGVLTADCGPILFADVRAGVVGAAHAGWKGALTGVTGATLDAMEGLGARRSNITAVIGPTISQAAYEVGPEFPGPFIENDPDNETYFKPSARARHWMFDLPGYLTARITAEGAGQVINLGICTFGSESRFFSYRRTTHRAEKDYGRQISAIALM